MKVKQPLKKALIILATAGSLWMFTQVSFADPGGGNPGPIPTPPSGGCPTGHPMLLGF